MRKRLISIVLLIPMLFLTGCGILTDDKNYNFPKDGIVKKDIDGNGKVEETEVFTNRNKNAEVYYDISEGMKLAADDSKTQGIIQDSVDAITKTWNDVNTDLFTVDENTISDALTVSTVNNLKSLSYAGNSRNMLSKTLDHLVKSGDKVVVPRIKLVVTDLSGQLDNYQQLAKEIDEKIIDQKQSFAILSVNTQKPFFIFAIGALNDLSSYLNNFYAMPSVSSFSGMIDWVGMDREYNINCKIYAQNSGIEGINYDGVMNIENGTFDAEGNFIFDMNGAPPPPPIDGGQPPIGQGQSPQGQPPIGQGQSPQGQPPIGQGQPPQGQPPIGQGAGQPNPDGSAPEPPPFMFQTETKGSFTKLRPDYRPQDAKTKVEGSVNLMPINDGTIELAVPENIDENDLAIDDIRYFSYRSLLWNKADILDTVDGAISGKMKITVPFNIMSQIQLSNLKFDVQTLYSDAKKSDNEFYDSDKTVKSNIEVAFADGGNSPNGNTWRIDNQDKTAMINIYVNDLAELDYATKLDIIFGAEDPGFMPAWVQEWSKKDGLRNLQNFIDILNDYNKTGNRFSEQLTIYLLAGDKDTYENAEIEALEKENASKYEEYIIKE